MKGTEEVDANVESEACHKNKPCQQLGGACECLNPNAACMRMSANRKKMDSKKRSGYIPLNF